MHSHGVVHRDLKPENIMLETAYQSRQDRIKIFDFGIAAVAGSRRLTFGKLSQVMGSPDYISPEQVKNKRGDARSDLYSVGVILYEMLTGETPFHGDNPFAIMNARLVTSPRPPSEINPAISPQLEAMILRALDRDPDRALRQRAGLRLGSYPPRRSSHPRTSSVARCETARFEAAASHPPQFAGRRT